jgi:hypothetical protein
VAAYVRACRKPNGAFGTMDQEYTDGHGITQPFTRWFSWDRTISRHHMCRRLPILADWHLA